MKFGIHNPSWVYGADAATAFDGLKSELLKTGRWTGELDQHMKDGRQVRVASRLQLESFDDRHLVIEHSG